MDNRKIPIIATIAITIVLLVSGFAFANHSPDNTPTVQAKIEERNAFGNHELSISTSEFLSHGFKIGDYVSVSVNEYHGYAHVITDYAGALSMDLFINCNFKDGKIAIAYQFAMDSFKTGETVTIKYVKDSHIDEQFAKYVAGVCERKEWMTDADYANFRNVTTTGIAPGILYRSSSVFGEGRGDCLDNLMSKAGVSKIIYLNGTTKDVEKIIEQGKTHDEYAIKLFKSGDMFCDFLGVKYFQDESFAQVFQYIADNEGPYDICCSLGKDRTGFVLIILEALMGATVEEMADDYFTTYINLYDIQKDSEEYKALDPMFRNQMVALHDPSVLDHLEKVDWTSYDLDSFDFKSDAEKYLIDNLGLSKESAEKIRQHLSGNP